MSDTTNRPSRPSDETIVSALGAIVFASDEPIPVKELARALGRMPRADVEKSLDELERRLERVDVGLRLERVAGGVQLATRTDVGEWVRRFFRHRNRTRLSPAALETLAIVAYRQPVTMPEIQAIRGKDPSAAVKGLLDRKLVKGLGRKKVVGSPMLYGTDRGFLEHFGLNDLDELPSIDEFDRFLEVLDELPGARPVEQPLPESAAPPDAQPAADA